MAYVRKTDTLVAAILHKVDQMSADTQVKYAESVVAFDAVAQQNIYAAGMTSAWSPQPALKGKMPREWCTTETRITCYLYSNDKEIATKIDVDGDWLLPPDDEYSGYHVAVDVRYQDMAPTLQALVDTEAKKTSTRDATKEKFEAIREQLKSFMNQHASLNTALKEMPELEMYVPAEYMRKHAEPSAPRTKAERPDNIDYLNIDVDVLTSAAVAHRIATA